MIRNHPTSPRPFISLALLSCGLWGFTAPPLPAATTQAGEKMVQIESVHVGMTTQGPVVLLEAGTQTLPIFVDPTVAGSIEGALSGKKFFRPLSHDLMHTILKEFGGTVTQVVITLRDTVYFGQLTIRMNDRTKSFDSRSSDAIALAIHFQAPIFVGKDLLEQESLNLRKHLDPETFL